MKKQTDRMLSNVHAPYKLALHMRISQTGFTLLMPQITEQARGSNSAVSLTGHEITDSIKPNSGSEIRNRFL